MARPGRSQPSPDPLHQGNRVSCPFIRRHRRHAVIKRPPVYLDIGGRGRPRRRPLLIGLAVGVDDAEIVFGVLIEIFRSNAVVADGGFPSKGDVTLEYLMRAAADLDVGAIAVEGLIVLRNSRRLLGRPVSVIARRRTLT
jgi:hypothetical protein